jgi:hypothetical protein
MGVLSTPSHRFAVASMLSLGILAAHRQGAFDGLVTLPATQAIGPENDIVQAPQLPVENAAPPLATTVAVRLQAPAGSWRPFEWDTAFNLPETAPAAPVSVETHASHTQPAAKPVTPAPVKPVPTRQFSETDVPVASSGLYGENRAALMFEAALFAPWMAGGLFGIASGLGAVFDAVTGRRREREDVSTFTGREPARWSWNLSEMETPSWPGWSGADPSEKRPQIPDPAPHGLIPFRELTTEDMTIAAVDDLKNIGAEIVAWQKDLDKWGQGDSDAMLTPETYFRTLQEFERRLAAIQEFLPESLSQLYEMYSAAEEALRHAALSFAKGAVKFVEEALNGIKLPNGVPQDDLGRYATMASQILQRQMEEQPLSVDQELRETLRARIDELLTKTRHDDVESLAGDQIIDARTTFGSVVLAAPRAVPPMLAESAVDVEVDPNLVFDGSGVPVIEVSVPE